jgi:hypothetical protein
LLKKNKVIGRYRWNVDRWNVEFLSLISSPYYFFSITTMSCLVMNVDPFSTPVRATSPGIKSSIMTKSQIMELIDSIEFPYEGSRNGVWHVIKILTIARGAEAELKWMVRIRFQRFLSVEHSSIFHGIYVCRKIAKQMKLKASTTPIRILHFCHPLIIFIRSHSYSNQAINSGILRSIAAYSTNDLPIPNRVVRKL